MPASTAELLSLLERRTVATAVELRRDLGISQPTFSRLVAAAGPLVLRVGRGRSTRYAARRALRDLGRELPVFRVDAAGRVGRVATLQLLAGGAHLVEGSGEPAIFPGLPPFAVDMSPQGYLGRDFGRRHPELHLPARVTEFTDDHRLVALATRGEDTVGDLVIGRESADRLLALEPREVRARDYPRLALAAATGEVGSSAGGEHPKFLALRGDRRVLVKFVAGEGPAARRWRDLVVLEALALELLRASGHEAPGCRLIDRGGMRFLEVERFDRVGPRGRRGVLSLAAIDAEWIGGAGSWSNGAARLREMGLLSGDDEREIRWRDVFGRLIANTDRHLGNLSVFWEIDRAGFSLAPAYDMLPMLLSPSGTLVVVRRFTPAPPTSQELDVFAGAAALAAEFWRHAARERSLEADVRALSRHAQGALAALLDRFG